MFGLSCASPCGQVERCSLLRAPSMASFLSGLSVSVTGSGFIWSRDRCELRPPWVAITFIIWAVHLVSVLWKCVCVCVFLSISRSPFPILKVMWELIMEWPWGQKHAEWVTFNKMDYDRYFIKEVCEQMTFYKENKLTLLCCSGAKVICFSLLWQILMDFFSPVKNEEKEQKDCSVWSIQ